MAKTQLLFAGGCVAFLVISFCILFSSHSSYTPPHEAVHYLAYNLTRTTKVENLVFGIGAGARTWERRKNYVRLWWRPNVTRGLVSLDGAVRNMHDDSLPPLEVTNKKQLLSLFKFDTHLNHVRIARLPSELFRLNFPDAHWFILSDDDTFFMVDNLVKVLSKYDYNELYYVGSYSESHHQSIKGFSTNMAFGGAGIALSYALVSALSTMQDDCLRRNEHLWGVDAKLQACVAELGVPLTLERGFHQMDLHGDVSSFLSSHPTTPLVSLHHLEFFNPIFPGMSQVESMAHLLEAIKVDPAGILQQSFCYNKVFNWNIKVSWGYVVEVGRRFVPPRELEHPMRTFWGWLDCHSEYCFNFRTRDVPGDPCLRSIKFFMANVTQLNSIYLRSLNNCLLEDQLTNLTEIRVAKEQSRYVALRRQCCDILNPDNVKMHQLHIRDCAPDEATHF